MRFRGVTVLTNTPPRSAQSSPGGLQGIAIIEPIIAKAARKLGIDQVAIHIAWFLIWVVAIAGLCFLVFHAVYVRYFAKARSFAPGPSPEEALRLPEPIPRHPLVGRRFHWVMAPSRFTPPTPRFLPKAGP